MAPPPAKVHEQSPSSSEGHEGQYEAAPESSSKSQAVKDPHRRDTGARLQELFISLDPKNIIRETQKDLMNTLGEVVDGYWELKEGVQTIDTRMQSIESKVDDLAAVRSEVAGIAAAFARIESRLDKRPESPPQLVGPEKPETSVSKAPNMHQDQPPSPEVPNSYSRQDVRSGGFGLTFDHSSRMAQRPDMVLPPVPDFNQNRSTYPPAQPTRGAPNNRPRMFDDMYSDDHEDRRGRSNNRRDYTRNQSQSRGRHGVSVPEVVVATKQEQFKASDIGFFHPRYSEDHGLNGYVVSGKETIYISVQMFVQAVKRYAFGKAEIAGHLYLCLRGPAQVWFTSQNPSKQQELLGNIEAFCNALTIRYEEHPSDAYHKLQTERYTVKDAQKQRQPDEYVGNLMRYAVPLTMPDLAVLTIAYNALDNEIKRHVRRPDTRTSVEDFTKDLEEAAGYWSSNNDVKDHDNEAAYQRGLKAGEKRSNAPPIAAYQPRQQTPYSGYNSGGYNRNQYANQPQRTQAPPAQNSPPQRTSQYPQRTSQYPQPGQKLLTNNASYNAFVPPSNEPGDHLQYDYNADSGYDEEQAPVNEDTKYITAEHANFGDITTTFHAEASQLEQFNDEEYTRHGMAPLSCNMCKESYVNNGGRARLDNHMFNIHGVDIKSNQAMDRKRYTNWMEHAALHVVTIRGPPPERGYATIQARLYDENNEEIPVCIDTGSSVSFIDESLLPEGNLWGRLHNCHPITVRGIAGERIVDKQMDIPLFVTATDGTVKRIEAKAYVSKGIKAGVILGMDELGKAEDDIALWLGRKKMQLGNCHVAINFTPRGSQPVAFFVDATPRNDYTGRRSCLKSFGGTKPVRKTVRFAEIMAKSPYKSARFSDTLPQAESCKSEDFESVYDSDITELGPLAIARSSAVNSASISADISTPPLHQRAGPTSLNWRARASISDRHKRSTMVFASGSRRRNLDGPWRKLSN